MVIDFFKAKEKIEKQKPQGYLGFLKRKADHEKLEDLVGNLNDIITTGGQELLEINAKSLKNVKYFWIIVGFIEVMLLITLTKTPNDSVSFWLLLSFMILFLAGAIVTPVLLKRQRQDIIEHSQPIILPKTEYPPYYSKN